VVDFTLREAAARAYSLAIGTSTGSVLGADMREVTACRLATIDRAEKAVRAAVGTPRFLWSEADDECLAAWLRVLAERRAALVKAQAQR
jgi:hypothetical protein